MKAAHQIALQGTEVSIAGKLTGSDRAATGGVVIEDPPQIWNTPVMHIGGRNRYVAQRRNLELTHIIWIRGNLEDSRIFPRVRPLAIKIIETVIFKRIF